METLFKQRLFAVWLVLVAITLIYFGIDSSANHGHGPVASTAVSVAAVCLALVKVRIIMREFMEVRNAPPVLSRLADLWVLLMAVALLGTYLAGRAVAYEV